MNGFPGIVCMMDDILVFGKNQEKHDQHLEAVLKQLASAGVMLNPKK